MAVDSGRLYLFYSYFRFNQDYLQ